MIKRSIRKSNGSRRIQMRTTGKSRVEQTHRDECNINTIVAKAHKKGLFPQRTDEPSYGDFTGAPDFHEAKNRIIAAKKEFMMLPSNIRTRFNNDPGEFLDYINDPQNRQDAIEEGIVPKPPMEEIVPPVEPVEPVQPIHEPVDPT